LSVPRLFKFCSDSFENGADGATASLGMPPSTLDFRIRPHGKDFPPRQKPGSFNLSHVMEKLSKPPS